MMSTKKSNTRSQNRGVNVQSDTENSQSLATSRGEGNIHSNTDRDYGKSIDKIKNDVKTVIELMGPTSPDIENSSTVESYRKATEESNNLYKEISEEMNQTLTEDYQLTTDCDQSIIPRDNVTVQDTDLLSTVENCSVTAIENASVHCTNICAPPVQPTNFVYNSECMCPQMANFIHNYAAQGKNRKTTKKNLFRSFLTVFQNKKCINNSPSKSKYYKINIQKSRKNIAPTRLVFDLVDNVHTQVNHDHGDCLPEKKYILTEDHFCLQPENETKYTKTKEQFIQTNKRNSMTNCQTCPTKKKFYRKSPYTYVNEIKKNVYYFDHGCSSYFQTTDRMPIITTEDLALRTEAYTTKFWAELFGSFNIGCSFFMSFVLQSIRFLLYSILKPLTVGIIQIVSDYFFKPMLTTLFNSVIQPILILFYNILTSIRDIFKPVAEAIGYFIREIAVLVGAFRIVEVKTDKAEKYSKKIDRKHKILLKTKSKDEEVNNFV
ncbi:uncharacterized protein LOC126885104 [Diabrotica virgifera virgifera]|uniref:Uncharacterized protein n=2 Tax=Diabrotica virgifera virgifera TaxID=50390 RepID=A0ABM5KBC5_DIAVI|nr:uncharacterized protein LOC126885104 [Diabrotica virgifera virgifera]